MSGNAARVQAVYQIINREVMPPKESPRLEDIWAENVFNLSKMQASLPKAIFKSIKKTIVSGEKTIYPSPMPLLLPCEIGPCQKGHFTMPTCFIP